MWQDYTIIRSVGRSGGKNDKDDVVTIQILLNRVGPANFGPANPLKTDGLCGDNTQDAIDHFQEKHHLGSDGRVDPGGGILTKINALIKPGMPPPEPALTIPPAGEPNKKLEHAVIMGIWGWNGDNTPN